ncbi:unnamed protein product [Protopolystoma xenopodis]|uniref:I/LWEQ domain-containing protein n=1 Tax=Protopolystoma xenopodis TaxID=117903 RepID=A0A3S5B505_9PLAT|nr:unnamed protein product [Protopolystoma xenopodis]
MHEVAAATAALVKLAKSNAMLLDQEAASFMSAVAAVDAGDIGSKSIPQQHVAEWRVASKALHTGQARLIRSATVAGMAASNLVTCAKVVACTMHQPASMHQLKQSARQVGIAVHGLTESVTCLANDFADCGDQEFSVRRFQMAEELTNSGIKVHECLDRLLERLEEGSLQARQNPAVISLLQSAEQLPTHLGDGAALLAQADTLYRAAGSLAEDLCKLEVALACGLTREASLNRARSITEARQLLNRVSQVNFS